MHQKNIYIACIGPHGWRHRLYCRVPLEENKTGWSTYWTVLFF